MSEFPKMLYKDGGSEAHWGRPVTTLIVESRGDQTDAEADGFMTAEALNGAPADEAPEGKYDKIKVADLQELAAERKIDLGDATKRADIVAALELADEAEASEQA